MRTDTELHTEGLRALLQILGEVDAERFIALIQREHFDYTEWREQQWIGETVASLAERARILRASDQPS